MDRFKSIYILADLHPTQSETTMPSSSPSSHSEILVGSANPNQGRNSFAQSEFGDISTPTVEEVEEVLSKPRRGRKSSTSSESGEPPLPAGAVEDTSVGISQPKRSRKSSIPPEYETCFNPSSMEIQQNELPKPKRGRKSLTSSEISEFTNTTDMTNSESSKPRRGRKKKIQPPASIITEPETPHTPSLLYDLWGVISHKGESLQQGHYIAYVKSDGELIHKISKSEKEMENSSKKRKTSDEVAPPEIPIEKPRRGRPRINPLPSESTPASPPPAVEPPKPLTRWVK